MPAASRPRNAPTLQRLNVTIANRQRKRAVDSSFLRRIVKSLLAELQIRDAELAIQLVATPEITRLNETFLGHAGSTDVITFDYAQRTNRNPQHSPVLHGEVFVCLDEAVVQARRFQTTWQAEVVRYTVHGVLHLLGFDDLNPASRHKMKSAEDRWLRQLARRFPLTRLARRSAAS
jgi:rRNA maturation RNase YbeY